LHAIYFATSTKFTTVTGREYSNGNQLLSTSLTEPSTDAKIEGLPK